MDNLNYSFNHKGKAYIFELVFVTGTQKNAPFLFGLPGEEQAVSIPGFFIAKFQTTQALWEYIMGDEQNHSQYKDENNPVEHVSWNAISQPGGFLEKLNEHFGGKGSFRLPTETEWEYAARGGQHWQDGFRFAGTNNMDEAGWYEGNSGPYHDLAMISQLKNGDKLTRAHAVGQKKANQLGLYDMNGNLWEWCQDWFVRDTRQIPKDSSAYAIATGDKVLRGGCHHNGAVHCTNTKRYEIGPEFFDGCIGFRVALTSAEIMEGGQAYIDEQSSSK